MTDYPDPQLVDNMVFNIDNNLPGARASGRVAVLVSAAAGHIRRAQATRKPHVDGRKGARLGDPCCAGIPVGSAGGAPAGRAP